MKKLIVVTILIMLGVAGYEFYQDHRAQILSITAGLKSGAAIENVRTEIFTPGGLRAKIESKSALLTYGGTFQATNEQRALYGKSALKHSQLLDRMAEAKVKDMFERQYFEHISPTGKGPADLADEAGYVYITVGENLALGNYKNDGALVEAWMNSPGHRANILNSKFTEIGVAVMKGTFEGKTTWLAVQEFGKPASECPKIDQFLKQQIDEGKSALDGLEIQVQQAKSELESTPEPQTQGQVDAYNAKINEFNSLVKVYNNRLDTQKQVISRYNEQVKAFNECIAK